MTPNSLHISPQRIASIGGFLSSTALLSTQASGAIVQVDFIGNQITAAGGNQLFTDIDFDGDSDFSITSTAYFNSPGTFGQFVASVSIEGASNRGGSSFLETNLNVVNGDDTVSNGFISVTLTGSSDLGDNHQGFLEVRALTGATGNNGVYIERFVFDDASATLDSTAIDLNTNYNSVGTTTVSMTTIGAASPIPEASSIAMLAAGAGGLLMRRRRQQEAA